MILFLAALFLRERITPAFIVLSLIAVAGMVVIVYDPSASSGQLIGVALTVAGIVCCAVYSVVTRRWIPDAKETSQVILSQQAHALGAGHRARSRRRHRRRPGRADRADTARARQRRSARASSTTPAPTGSTSGPCATSRPRRRRVSFYLIPIVGVAAGAILLGERLDPRQWVGAVIVLAAILAILRQPSAGAIEAAAT